jgi:hypothetical protein
MSDPQPTFTPSSRRRSAARRIPAIVVGSILALVAMGLLAAGGVLIWADSHKDSAGYVSTGTEPFHSGTYAIATDNLDMHSDLPGWASSPGFYGKLKLSVTSNDGKPVFVGVAPTDRVNEYLRTSAHTSVSDVNYAPFSVDYSEHGGTAAPAAPASQAIWAASAHGAGPQTLKWDVKDGNWSVVVMNEDGSPVVDASVKAGIAAPVITPLAWTSTGGGLILLAAAGGLLFLGIRPRKPGSAARPEARVSVPA